MNNRNYTITHNSNKSNPIVGSTKRKEVIDIRSDLISSQKEIATQLESKTVDQLMMANCRDDVNKAVLFVKWYKAHQDVKFRDFNKLYTGFYDKSMYSRMVRYSQFVLENTKLDTIPESSLRKLISKLTKMQSEIRAEILQTLTGFVDATATLTAKDIKSKIAELIKPYIVKKAKPIVTGEKISVDLKGKTTEEQIALISNVLSTLQAKMVELQGNAKPVNQSITRTQTLADKIQALLNQEHAGLSDRQNIVKALTPILKINGFDNYTNNAANDNQALAWKLVKGELKASEFVNVQTYDDIHAIALKVLDSSKIQGKRREVA